ncbi:IgGFc-binding protein-like [Mytilus edulis]|uniref:IgGFc-binding protein-like n=1 Tax=Mytilus edulis TaxID=6550 RepID=UPI0039F0B3A7
MPSLRSKVLIATDNSTLIWVYYSKSRIHSSTFIHISEPYYYPETNLVTRDGYNTAGIEVSSEVPMSMYGFIQNDWDDNSEGFLAFPVHYAAKSYIVPSFTVSKLRGFSVFSPLESDTKIQINLKMKSGSLVFHKVTYKNKDTIQIVLQKHETFQLSHSSDLTGTLVTANKRFLLISGNVCSYIINIGGCNPFIEMVLPINQLDKFSVIPKIVTRHTCTVRILAVNFTIVKIKLGEHLIEVELQARQFHDFSYTDSSSVSASDDIMVIVFPHEEASTRSNSFMMTIHGTNQFLNEYLFVVPEGFTSFLSVVVETVDTDGFVLDDMSVTNDLFDRQSIISESMIFSTFSIRVKSGRHKFTHLKGTFFGLWVYGNAWYDGYGYPAGLAMKTHV